MRAAIRSHLALGPASRLLAFAAGALDAGDPERVAHLVLCATAAWPPTPPTAAASTIASSTAAPSTIAPPILAPSVAIVTDPLRLPFVEALFDTVLIASTLELSDAPAAFLREVRRVIAPAGAVVLVVPRRRLSFANALPGQHYSRARVDRLLVEAMFEPLDWATFGGVHLVRARPRGGVAMMPVGGGHRATARVAPA